MTVLDASLQVDANEYSLHVETSYNTSTIALRGVRGNCRDSKVCSQVLQELDLRTTALAKSSTNGEYELQMPSPVSEGVPQEQNRKYLKIITAEAKEELKNGVFWDVTPCGFCKNRRFGGT
jgi:hypothetical protein